MTLELSVRARHHADNALAALLAYEALGLPLDEAHVGAGNVELSRWRGEEVPLPGGGLLINDAWNASPLSMRAAHRSPRRGRGRAHDGRRPRRHGGARPRRRRASTARSARTPAPPASPRLLAVGPLAAGYVEGAGFGEAVPDVDAAREALTRLVQPGDCVLIKASRAMGLEALAEQLTKILA